MSLSSPRPETQQVPPQYLALFLRAEAFVRDDAHDKAANIYRQILRQSPRNLIAARNLGAALAQQDRLEEALAVFQSALKHHPNVAALHYNIGVLLQRLHCAQEALKHYESAYALDPQDTQNLENLAGLRMNLGDYKGARDCIDRVLAIEPARAGTLFTYALLLLLQGEWHDGWHLYEYRWETPDFKTDTPDKVARGWQQLADVRDRSVLLIREQGLGDTLQFCRYALLLAQQGAHVSMVVQSSLMGLLSCLNHFHLPHPIELIDEKDFAWQRAYHYWLPMMSAPLLLMKDYPKIPSLARYIEADQTQVMAARARLPDNSRPHIGLVWSGNPQHRNDRHRSVAFKKMARLLSAQANFHILQTEIRADEEAFIAPEICAGRLFDHREFLTSFEQTAGLLACMDLVIAVDTSVVHLAGAMGRPTWIALPYTPDFRWLLEREDSPWYPSVRLFRQSSYDDWDGLITRLQNELHVWLEANVLVPMP